MKNKSDVSARERKLIDAACTARLSLTELARNAGDVPEWNKRGHAYKACRKLDKALAFVMARPYITI